MGRKIDRIIGNGLLFLAPFAFFLFAWRNLYIALATAILFFAVSRRIARFLDERFGDRKRAKGRKKGLAEAVVRGLLYEPEDMALTRAAKIILSSSGYETSGLQGTLFTKENGERIAFSLIRNHPDGAKTDASDVLKHWHANRDCDTLVLINTGYFDEKARLSQDTYTVPRVRTIDYNELIMAALKTGVKADEACPAREKKKTRGKHIAARLTLISQKGILRNALYGAILMALYLLIGIKTYLFISLFLLALAALGLKKPAMKETML